MNRVYLAEVATDARRDANEKQKMTFRVSAKSECLAFVQFFQLRYKLGTWQIPLELPKFLPVAVEDNERGESIHIILTREFQVLLFQFSSLSLRPRTTRPREVEL
jgi:hypothetical protein